MIYFISLWLTLYSIGTRFDTSLTDCFRKHRGKGRNCSQFLLFLQYFILKQIIVSSFVHVFSVISLFAAEVEEPRIGIGGKGLIWGNVCLKREMVRENDSYLTILVIFTDISLLGQIFAYINHKLMK